jgi:hypothetical protein
VKKTEHSFHKVPLERAGNFRVSMRDVTRQAVPNLPSDGRSGERATRGVRVDSIGEGATTPHGRLCFGDSAQDHNDFAQGDEIVGILIVSGI